MITIKALIWDEWNKTHIKKHDVTTKDVMYICTHQHEVRLSYRKRILVIGKLKNNKTLVVVLSPEDEKLQPYEDGTYYVVTAFIKKDTL